MNDLHARIPDGRVRVGPYPEDRRSVDWNFQLAWTFIATCTRPNERDTCSVPAERASDVLRAARPRDARASFIGTVQTSLRVSDIVFLRDVEFVRGDRVRRPRLDALVEAFSRRTEEDGVRGDEALKTLCHDELALARVGVPPDGARDGEGEVAARLDAVAKGVPSDAPTKSAYTKRTPRSSATVTVPGAGRGAAGTRRVEKRWTGSDGMTTRGRLHRARAAKWHSLVLSRRPTFHRTSHL